MSDAHREPPSPTFEHARSHARQLLRACRSGEPRALAFMAARLPRLAALTPAAQAMTVRLADTQHALAVAGGFENWAALKRHFAELEPLLRKAARFLDAIAREDAAAVRRQLADLVRIARTSIHAAAAACDLAAVESFLARDPSLALARHGGGGGWTPLDCVAASPLPLIDPARADAGVAIAERLIALGADANGATPSGEDDGDGDGLLSVLYRASAQGNVALVRVLLAHGAQPNDGESVFHAAERNHRDVLELLLAHGADLSAPAPRYGNTPLYFLAGYRDGQRGEPAATEGMRWLLEHGADPDVPSGAGGETPLHRVADFGRGRAVATLLLDRGADPARERADGRTCADLALRAGNTAVLELLRERGVPPRSPRPVDAFLGACAIGDADAARAVLEANPGLLETLTPEERDALTEAARTGREAAVRVLVAMGFDPARESRHGGTPLHHAAWFGRAAAARALVELGAPLDVRDRTYGSSPIAWAAHGSRYSGHAGEHAEVVELLLAAGAGREASFNNWGEPPEALASREVAALLRERGFAPPAAAD